MISAFVDTAGEAFDEGVVVGGHDDGSTLSSEVVEDLCRLNARGGVLIASGLVSENEARMIEDSTCDADALLLASREFIRHGLLLIG